MRVNYIQQMCVMSILLYSCMSEAVVLKLEKNNYEDPIIVVHEDCTQEDLAGAMDQITRSFFARVPYEKGVLVSLDHDMPIRDFYPGFVP